TNVRLARPETVKPIGECRYDVCVVGARSPRRNKIYRALERNGVTLSPQQSSDFESVVGDSRIVLNVRQFRCDNCEISRIVTGLALGRIVVTEQTYGLAAAVPEDHYCCTTYDRLVPAITGLLADAQTMDLMGARAAAYIAGDYALKCRR